MLVFGRAGNELAYQRKGQVLRLFDVTAGVPHALLIYIRIFHSHIELEDHGEDLLFSLKYTLSTGPVRILRFNIPAVVGVVEELHATQ